MKLQSITCPPSRYDDVWETELQCDPIMEYILHGIKHGFHFTDTNQSDPSTALEVESYPSATSYPNRHLVRAQIQEKLLKVTILRFQENSILLVLWALLKCRMVEACHLVR